MAENVLRKDGHVLHADARHEHVLLSGRYDSHWFGLTHALVRQDGVKLIQVNSAHQAVGELELSEAEMEALIEVWNRRHSRVEEQKAGS